MSTLHRLSVSLIGVLAAATLAGCSILSPQQPSEPSPPETPAEPTISVEALNDTSWEGTDSGGIDTSFTLHAGGSTAVSFRGNTYDDPGDTWALDGDVLTIIIYNVENRGDVVYVGEVADEAGPIDLDLTFSGVTETATLTITKSG